jgi:erythromycin esterase-like protein
LIADLIDCLNKNKIDHSMLDGFFKLGQKYLSLAPVDQQDRQEVMQAGFAYLEAALLERAIEDQDFWRLILDNFKARYVYTEFGHSRDLQMANNFKYIYETIHQSKKTILWSHAFHGLPIENNLGGFVKSWYGDDVYVCHLTGNEGSTIHFETGENSIVHAAPFPHIEEKLAALGIDIALITATIEQSKQSVDVLELDDNTRLRLLSYSSACQLNRIFSTPTERGLIDSIVFINKIIPSQQMQSVSAIPLQV